MRFGNRPSPPSVGSGLTTGYIPKWVLEEGVGSVARRSSSRRSRMRWRNRCTECEKRLPRSGRACPHCGARVERKWYEVRRLGTALAVLALVTAVVLSIVAIAS